MAGLEPARDASLGGRARMSANHLRLPISPHRLDTDYTQDLGFLKKGTQGLVLSKGSGETASRKFV